MVQSILESDLHFAIPSLAVLCVFLNFNLASESISFILFVVPFEPVLPQSWTQVRASLVTPGSSASSVMLEKMKSGEKICKLE